MLLIVTINKCSVSTFDLMFMKSLVKMVIG